MAGIVVLVMVSHQLGVQWYTTYREYRETAVQDTHRKTKQERR